MGCVLLGWFGFCGIFVGVCIRKGRAGLCWRFGDFGCSFAMWKRFWLRCFWLGFGGLGDCYGSVVCIGKSRAVLPS